MRRYWLWCSCLVVAAYWMSVRVAAQEAASPNTAQKVEASLKAAERFDGRATLHAKDGSPRELHVVVRNWVIHPGEQVTRFPERDFTIVELVAGTVVTVIDGQEKEFTGGFWTVPAGGSMSIRVKSESASLQTVTIRRN
jgi:hypothetical protein